MKTLEGYADWMKGLFTPCLTRYEIVLRRRRPQQGRRPSASYTTHNGPGGPVPPTGKSLEADYVYVMQFDGDKIRHMTKVWNDGHHACANSAGRESARVSANSSAMMARWR